MLALNLNKKIIKVLFFHFEIKSQGVNKDIKVFTELHFLQSYSISIFVANKLFNYHKFTKVTPGV